MIYGIGTDVTSISRIKRIIRRYGRRFLTRIYTEEEIEKGMKRKDNASFFAGRFAAREAFLKALGYGLMRGIPIKGISILNNEDGKPYFMLSPEIEKIIKKRNISTIHLSISHDADIAQAVVVMEGG
ncbi:MAG TPA: holo-ACP synthase [Candidatus Krumholzibacteriaceae bacterium]|nr:holo-ACP synthase [Candidatus Krumholzibacteriaceae bacterium]